MTAPAVLGTDRLELGEGAIAVGVGSPLIGDAGADGDLNALRERARTFLDVVRPEARP